jgi:hypothetical protein
MELLLYAYRFQGICLPSSGQEASNQHNVVKNYGGFTYRACAPELLLLVAVPGACDLPSGRERAILVSRDHASRNTGGAWSVPMQPMPNGLVTPAQLTFQDPSRWVHNKSCNNFLKIPSQLVKDMTASANPTSMASL